jgi:hypothetical protein
MNYSSSRRFLVAYNQNYYVLMEEKRSSFNITPTAPNYLNAIKNVDNIKLIDQSQSLDNLNISTSPEEKAMFFNGNSKKSIYSKIFFLRLLSF